LEVNLPEFIAVLDWPSGSPNLNPLDYRLWSILEEKACLNRLKKCVNAKGGHFE